MSTLAPSYFKYYNHHHYHHYHYHTHHHTHHRVEAFLCHLLYFHAESSRSVDSWRRTTAATGKTSHYHHHYHHHHHQFHHHHHNRHHDHIHHYHHYAQNYVIIDLGPIHFRSSWISRQWWSNPSWYDIHVDDDVDDSDDNDSDDDDNADNSVKYHDANNYDDDHDNYDDDYDDEDNADSIAFDSNHYLSCQVLSISLMQHVFLILWSWLHLMRWGVRVMYEE